MIDLAIDVTDRIAHEITCGELRQALDLMRERDENKRLRAHLNHEPPGAVGYPQPTDEARQEPPYGQISGSPGALYTWEVSCHSFSE